MLLHCWRCRWRCCFFGLTSSERFKFLTATHDKAAHFTVFLVESWLFVRVFVHRSVQLWPLWARYRAVPEGPEVIDLETGDVQAPVGRTVHVNKYAMAGVVCVVGAAIGSEYAQHVLTHGRRSFDPWDMLCNALGSCTGILIAYVYERR